MKVFGREPVVWIGIIVSCIIAVLSVLTGQGVVSDALAGNITDGVNAVAQLLVILSPIIAAILSRPTVTPVAQPSLPVGTPVLVQGTGDEPPPDAVVALKTTTATVPDDTPGG
jgi:uncharacterized membrane protein